MSARPLYENDRTRAAEQSAINRYCEAKGLDLRKLPIAYAVDFALFRGNRLHSWVEYKSRPGVERYATIFLSAKKVAEGKRLHREFGGSFVFLVESGGVLRYLDLSARDPDSIEWGGRKDRGDWQDMEPMCHYRLSWFQELRA